MFTPKKLLLAATTFIAVETAFISPLQALTFRFRYTSPLSAIGYFSATTGDSGSLTIDGWNGNFNPSYSNETLSSSGPLNLSTMSWWFGVYGGPLAVARHGLMYELFSTPFYLPSHHNIPLTWRMSFFCPSSNIMNCNNSSGTLGIRFGSSASNPTYSAGIIVDNFSLSPPTTPPPISNSVPEPSLISALLLLGSSLLLGKKRKMVIRNLG